MMAEDRLSGPFSYCNVLYPSTLLTLALTLSRSDPLHTSVHLEEFRQWQIAEAERLKAIAAEEERVRQWEKEQEKLEEEAAERRR